MSDVQVKEMPDFASWQRETLVDLAKASYTKMREQEAEIRQLKLDVKTTLDAYRKAVRKEMEQ